MARTPFSVHTAGDQQLRELIRRLRAEGRGDLRKRLNTALRAAGQDAVQSARDAIMSKRFESDGIGDGPKKPSSHRGGGRKQRTADRIERASTEHAKDIARKRDTGLRSTLARNVKLSVTAKGVKILVPKGAVPDWVNPGRDTDKGAGWRHPVFGNKKVWVVEKGGPWFSASIQEKAPAFRQALNEAIAETVRSLSS